MTRTATQLRRRLALSSALGMSLVVIAVPATGQETNTPTLPTVQSGIVTFDNGGLPINPLTLNGTQNAGVTGTATTLNVNLTSQKSLIEWATFDIASNSTVNFTRNILLPNQAVLNRVTTGDLSQLAGQMNAPSNISVWLINTNGIAFGNGAAINVGGLVASTLNITSDNDFLTSNSVQFQGALAANGAISTLAGTPAVINTNNGVLALIAPQITSNFSSNSGTGATAFVMATDVNLTTSPGGPLSVTINAGTRVPSSTVGGAIVGDRVYALIKPQDTFDTLLSVTAPVSNATVNAVGVVVLSGGGFSSTSGADTLSTGAGNLAGDTGSASISSVAFATPRGAGPTAPTTGDVNYQVAGGTLAIGAASAAGLLNAGNQASATTLAGAVSFGGEVNVRGATVTAGAGASFTSNNDNAGGGLLRIGSSDTAGGLVATTALNLTGSTLNAGANGQGLLELGTANDTGQFAIGAVRASQINGRVGPGAGTVGTVDRTGAISVDSLALTGANTLASDGTLTVAGAVATGGNLLLQGDAGVTIGGAMSNIGAGTGSVTVNGNTGAAGVSLQGSNLAGALIVDAGTGGVSFTNLAGAGSKSIESDGGITGTSISGAGTVLLRAGTSAPLSITGTLGTSTTRLGALSISGSNGVTIGTTGATGTTAFLTDAQIGTAPLAVVNNLVVNGGIDASGTFAARSDNAVTLNDIAVGTALQINAGGAGASFGAVSGAGTKQIVSFGSIGATSIRGAGAVTLTGGLGATEGVTVAGGIGANGAAVSSLNIDGGNVSLGALFVTGAAQFGQALGMRTLTVTGATDAGSILSDSSQATEFQGAVRARTGAINIGSATSIEFDGTVDGPAALVVRGGAGLNVTFRGAVGGIVPFTTFSSVANSVVNLNGGLLATSGTQSYGGSLVLGANTVLAGSDATFTNGITGGGFDLALNFSGAQALTGAGIAGVRNLSTDAAGSTSLNGSFSTTGTQTFNDAVTLAGATALVSTGAGAAGNIRFGSTLNGANTLTVTTPGTVSFAGVVGGTAPLTSITTTGAAATAIQTANVTTTGGQVYGATSLNGAVDVSLDAGAAPVSFTALNGPRGLSVNTTGVTTLPGGGSPLAFILTNAGGTTSVSGTLTTTGIQAFGDPLVLGAATTLVGTQAIFNAGVIGGGFDLTLNTSGAQTLGVNVTGVGALTTDAAGTLTLNADLTTSGAQTFNDPTTLGATVQVDAGANQITFNNTLTGTNEGQLLFVTGSPVAFNGDVGGAAGGGVRLAAIITGGPTSLGGAGTRTIRTVGTQTYGGALTLNTDAVLVGAGATFTGQVNGTAANRDLTLTFTNANTIAADPFVNLGDLLVNGAGASTLAGNVTTVGGQNYVSALTLGANAVLASTGNQAISFAALTGGGNALTVNTTGATTFNNGGAGFASIVTNAGGTTTLNGTLDSTGLQTYGDDVVLGSATVVQSSAGGALTFGGTVTGAQDLTVATAGLTTFTGAVTSNSLSSVGTGAVQLNGGSVTTTTTQAYAGQLRLGADTVLTGTTGTFTGGVLGNGNDLALDFSGPTVIDGGFTGIGDLSSGGGGTTTLSGIIDTLGGQTYADAVTLGAATTLRSGGGTGVGAIGFASTLDGTQALTVTTGGTTTFTGAVGSVTPLTSLTVDGTGAIAIDGGGVATTGAQSYTGAATLLNDTLLATDGGNVLFAATVSGPVQLSIRTGPAATPVAGAVSLGGAVTVNALAIRADAATASSLANDVGTLAALVNTGGFAFADGNALTVDTVDGLSGIAAGTGALTLTAGGLLTLAANTGAGVTALTGVGITQNAGTSVNAGAGAITLDAQDGALALSGTLTTTNGTAGAVRLLDAGAAQLGTIQTGAAGTVTLGGAAGDDLSGAVTQVAGSSITAGTLIGNVGGAATLTNVNSIGTLGAFSAGSLALRNAGALAVTGPVVSGGALSLDIDAGNLALNGNVTAAGTTTLTVDAGGISQAAGSVLTTPVLTGSAAQGVSLTGANQIASLDGFTVAAGGFTLNDARALAVTQDVNVTGPLSITAIGIEFSGRTITATGAATLNGQAGAVTGATLTAGGNATVAGDTVNLTTASAGTTPAGTLSVTAQNGLTLGNGTAGQAIALSTAAGALNSATLTAGTPGNTASVTSITTSSGGATTIGTATSNNGAIAITGGSADVTSAVATNGALGITTLGGALLLGTGNAGTTATLTAAGPLTVTTSLTSGGNAQATATGAASVESVTSNTGSVLVRGSSANVRTASADTSLSVEATAGNAGLTTGSARTGNAIVIASGATAVGTLGTLATPIGGGVTIAANGGDAIVGTAVATGAALLSATGLAQAGTFNGSSVTGTGNSVDVTETVSGSTLGLTATGGSLRLGTGTAAGAATLSAATSLDVTTLGAGGQATTTSGGATTIDAITGIGVSITGQSAAVRQAAATAGNLAIRGTAGPVSLTTGTATGTATLQADNGPLTIGTSLNAAGDIALLAGQALTAGTVTSTGGAIAAQGLSAAITLADARTTLDVTATGGDVLLPTGMAGGNATVRATGSVALTTLSSGGIASVTATAGDVTGTSVVASGAASASAGNLLRLGTLNGAGVTGTAAVVDVTNSASTGALALTASGGPLTLGTGSAANGTATLAATGALTVATSLTSTGNATATATGAATIGAITSNTGNVTVNAQSATVTSAAANQALTLTTTGGGLTLGTGTATNGTATLTAAGPLSVTTRVTGNGNASATATGAATVAAITSNTGAVVVSGTATSVTAATARTTLDLTATAGALTLGTGNAGGTATLRASGALGSTSLTTTGGGAASLTAGTTLNSGTLNAAGAATLVATGAATLGQTTSGAAVAVTAATIGAGQTAAGTTLALTSTGNLTLAGATAGGNATFDAGGTAALGQVLAGGTATIAIRALDAAITGIQRAGTVSFTNRAPTTTATRLGDNTAAGGFSLSATEVNLVEANQLTVDAGAGNVEVGRLGFDADAGRTRVDVLATGRVDVNGGVSGTGATRTFRLGGTAAGTDAKASVIRVTAVLATSGAANTGGGLLFDTANLDLRGARIGVGQAGGFLDPIGFGTAPGLSAADVGAQFIGNPNSSLYNASFGGLPYAPDTTLVSAGSLTVRYTSYALFQNTGQPGSNSGVALGTVAAGPQPNALVVQGPGSGTTNAFALFGTIGGISNTSTAVLGSNVIATTGTDAANTRINGCLVGSGAGCLTAVVSQPLLAIFDSSRLVIFQVGDDLVVPFDPVIGTNNEALFSGIGVIGADGGVVDDGISDTECTPDSTNPACGQAKEQGK